MYTQIPAFLPVSQLSPENYPRVAGGDKTKILEKLKSLVGQEIEVKIITLDRKEEKLVVSEKDAWQEKQKTLFLNIKLVIQLKAELLLLLASESLLTLVETWKV